MFTLDKAIRRKCITQKEFARRLDLTPAAVTRWVDGTYQPSPEKYPKIATELNLSGVDELIEIIDATKAAAIRH
jgi:transcriptional regulator with XRE-family HTH domain